MKSIDHPNLIGTRSSITSTLSKFILLKFNHTISQYSPTGCELKAHERDVATPAPTILKPPAPRDRVSMDDVTDFPE